MLNALIMTVLIIAALTWFTLTMRRKIRVLLKAKPDVRWDRIPERIVTMLRVAIAQVKMFKEPASGLMHALLFWGFLILLLRTISVFGRAYVGGPVASEWTAFWFAPALNHAYTFLKDWTELLVLIMVVAATFRRAVVRPARLTLKPSAYLILGLVAALMLTDFLYDGMRFAAGHGAEELSWSPVTAFVAGWFPAGADWLPTLIQTVFWIHVLVLLFFLNELPLSKHFHVITSIPNTFFAKLDAPGAIAPIRDMENQETFGVIEPRELTWKQIFDGYSCTECGRCIVNCPAYNTNKPLQPKLIIGDMRDFVKQHEADILAGKDTLNAEAPAPDAEQHEWKVPADKAGSLLDAVGKEPIWECTTCRSCEENCPVMITHVDKIVDFRRRMVLVDGECNPEVQTTLKNLEQKGNPWGLPSADRGLWLKELGAPLMSEKPEGVEWLWYVGCSASYDDRNKKVAAAFLKLLKKAGVDFAILGPEEGCCGDTARRLGEEYLFQTQAQQNIEVFKQYKFKKIVTMCPHGLNTIKNEYPQFGGNFEVVHHTELLAQLIAAGTLAVPATATPLKVVFHDSCYLGRYNQIYEAPRDVLRALPGADLREVERSKQNGFCCGAGGGMIFREEHVGDRINRARVQQLDVSGAETIATACPFCLTMCHDGASELNIGERLQTRDVAELLAERMDV
ncbi:MAG: heterodisulfide reductase-related iron-sulfur binding cluster [Kiritimatiellaeota bacterium]|nr:heterodisulfide reductase-related iron-sulfur binding cluster [Kiritimatiellota bacterium]